MKFNAFGQTFKLLVDHVYVFSLLIWIIPSTEPTAVWKEHKVFDIETSMSQNRLKNKDSSAILQCDSIISNMKDSMLEFHIKYKIKLNAIYCNW